MAKQRASRPEDDPRAPLVDRLRERLDSYMSSQGLRSTGQRRLIVQRFLETTEHVTVDDLFNLVRKEDQSVSHATVYRTLRMLHEGGIAEAHKFSDGQTRYELANDEAHHDHLICVECGRIQEFEEPLIEELQRRIAEKFGYKLVDHKHELYGVCGKCAA